MGGTGAQSYCDQKAIDGLRKGSMLTMRRKCNTHFEIPRIVWRALPCSSIRKEPVLHSLDASPLCSDHLRGLDGGAVSLSLRRSK